MRISCFLFWLLALAAGNAPGAQIVTQEITVVTGITESVVVGLLQVVPAPGESGALVAVPVLLPATFAGSAATAYAATQPTLALGPRSFTPTGYRNSGLNVPGVPSGWQAAVFLFQIPPQFAGRGFTGKLMYVQPQMKNVVPLFPLFTLEGSASKVTFLPGNNHSLKLASRSSLAAVLEEGMLTLRPTNGELIFVQRLETKERPRVAETKKTSRRKHFILPNPFEGLFPKRKTPPSDSPPPILPGGMR